MNYGKKLKKACKHLGFNGKTLHSLKHAYSVIGWAMGADIKMVSQEIGHTSVMMTEKYSKFNLIKLSDDFPSLKDRINLRLTSPSEDSKFTDLV